jgi:hypothetical protein
MRRIQRISELRGTAPESCGRNTPPLKEERVSSIVETSLLHSLTLGRADLNERNSHYCPAPLSILLATLTPLSPFTYRATPR